MPFLLENIRASRSVFLISLSLMLHAIFLVFLPFITRHIPDYSSQDFFEIESISSQQLERLKTAGVIKGSKEFSQPLSLSQLGSATLGTPTNMIRPSRGGAKVMTTKNIPVISSGVTQRLPDQISVAVKFDPPEGVPEDELNAIEKVLFGFNKRLYRVYVSAVMRTLGREIRVKPFVERYLTAPLQVITATVVFNAKGDVISVINIAGTNDYYLITLFKKMLENINTIPNPPEYLTKNKQFKINFSLKIGMPN